MQLKTSTTQLREYLETKQGKTYFIAIITMITVAIMLIFAIVPATKSITDKIAQNSVRRDYLEALKEKDKNMKDLLNEEENSQSELVFLESALPSSRNDEFVLANISEMAVKSNTNLVNADFGESTPAKDITDLRTTNKLSYVPMTLSVQGTIPNLGEFVKKIEAFPVPFLIEDISFNNNVRNQNLPISKGDTLLTMTLSYYHFNNATE